MNEMNEEIQAPVQRSESIYQGDEIDFRELFSIIWAGKFVIVLVTFVFAVGGVIYALQKPDIYRASILLAPTEGGTGPQFGGQLEGLASLAGVNLGGDGVSKSMIAKEVLQSTAFLRDFIKRHGLAVPLLGTIGWNKVKNEWFFDPEIYDPDKLEWGVDSDGLSLKPTDWDLVEKFRQAHLSLSQNKDNGMVTVSVASQSPIASKEWVEWLIRDLNEYMRTQDIEEAEARIQHLNKMLTETDIAGMQKVFYELIETETRTVMLANARKKYVFKTIDPAVVPQAKSGPNRALIATVSAILGGMIGVFFVVMRALFRKDDQGKPNFLTGSQA